MKILYLLLLTGILLSSCRAGRKEQAVWDEVPSAPELLKPAAQAAETAGEAEGGELATEESAPEGSSLELEGNDKLPASSVQGIASFDWDSARIQPSCYLEGRESFPSKSYHDMSFLYFVGFSQDGKVAFLKQEEQDGKGSTDLYFIVQDLVSDEILWNLQAPTDESYWMGKDLMTLFLADNEDLIDQKLADYGIRIAPCSYEKLPYTGENGERIDARIESKDTGKLYYDMFSIIRYSCIACDGAGRKKTVVSGKELPASEAFVCGYVKNPYEDRLALVIAEAVYGFEGCDILYSLAGCDMKKGFK